ncbi:MAG: flagellar biosynthetic protein FliQ [Pseudomonadota bacterium]
MQGEILDILRESLWAAAMISMPLLVTALIVGVIIGLFQALTSIQEMTLTFVPKLLAIMVAFWLTADYMLRTLSGLFTDRIIPLVAS